VPLRHAERADGLVVMVGSKPRDTDGNGFPDTIDVTAMLIEGARSEPVLVPGTFEFELEPLGEEKSRPWRVWTIGVQAAAAAAGPMIFDLPGYGFSLDLRTNGGDRIQPTAANVLARFRPASGAPVVQCAPEQRIVYLGGS